MALAPRTSLGDYEILSLLGAGGMGEVYRALDTNLKREVAIKVLPVSLAGDAERIARFQREAEVLASLNHPNIAAIYGLESSDGLTALVMEMVEGDDLSERIVRGPIPLNEALPIARQIAEALEAAHEQRIVHRDLKPANIKVRDDGTVKVLDFGLAKAMEPIVPPGAGALISNSPTITSPALMTGVGLLLGTAAYMSPEQAKGRPVDRRSDIWAFGCILFEMLTAKQAFCGDSVTEVLAAVLTGEPAWNRLPATVGPGVERIMRRCLRKDPASRVQAIGDVRLELTELGDEFGLGQAPVRPAGRVWVLGAAGGLVLGTVATALIMHGLTGETAPVGRPRSLQVSPTGTAAVATSGLDNDVTITPDGSRIVYVGDRGTKLFVRAIDALEPRAIATGELRAPFISPDGQWVGFLADGQTIRKVPINGGPASTVINVIGGLRGASWTPQGTIVFAGLDSTGLQEVSADGGRPELLTTPDRAHNEQNHWWPEALPDGKSILLTIVPTGGHMDTAQIALLDRQTKRWKVLVRGGSNARYDPRGYLIYGAAGTVYGARFDLARAEIVGTPIPVIQGAAITPLGAMNLGAAQDGTLVYVPAASVSAQRTLVWVDRQGQKTPVGVPPRMYVYPRVSPDGLRITVSSQDEDYDLWSWDIRNTTLTRLTFEAGQDSFPAWTPDGKRLAFVSTRSGGQRLYSQAADGTGVIELLEPSIGGNVSAISPDGRWVVFARNLPTTGFDVMKVALDSGHQLQTVLQTSANERNAEISPNGKWLAYQSDESGRYEVYVRTFPIVDSGRWQISYTGGTRPVWGPGGHELFYLAGDTLTQVVVADGATWAAGSPRELFKAQSHVAAAAGRSYDMTPDGKRFVAVDDAAGGDAPPISLVVIERWDLSLTAAPGTRE